MRKLSNEELEVGRKLLRAQDYDAFDQWMVRNRVTYDREKVVHTMRMINKGDPQRAITFFDQVFVDQDFGYFRDWRFYSAVLVVVLGLAGGLISLFR